MRFLLLAVLLGGVAYCVSEGANARSIAVKATTSYAQMAVHGTAEPPVGFVEFCARLPEDGNCMRRGDRAPPVMVTGQKFQELRDINNEVNRTVKPMSDIEQYHTIEYWTYPDSGKGDCEDYVLLKQRKLLEHGWPRSDLLITVVRDENTEGHAILTVRTSSGDLILDNKHSRIEPWERTPYTYIKRQSSADPLRWESLIPIKQGPTVSSSGKN